MEHALLMLAVSLHTTADRAVSARSTVRLRWRDERGQATTEYALVLLAAALVASARHRLGHGGGRRSTHRPPVQQRDRLGDRQGVGRRCSGERGQAAIEFALSLPLVLLVILALVQIAVVARDRMAVELAAREGARAAAVSADPAPRRLAVDRVTTLDAIDVGDASRRHRHGHGAHREPHRRPADRPLLPDVTVATATMAWEPP